MNITPSVKKQDNQLFSSALGNLLVSLLWDTTDFE